MILTARYLSKLFGITLDAAATLLAKACERKEIYGCEHQGMCMYEVTDEWIERARHATTRERQSGE